MTSRSVCNRYMPLLLAALMAGAPLASLAGVERYDIDPRHTYPSLEFHHLGISVWRGKFTKTRGTLLLDRAAHSGSVQVIVDTASIDFGLEAMDREARSKDYFDVMAYPTATYVGKLRFVGDKPVAVDGNFTFRGVTHPLTLKINEFGCIMNPVAKKQSCGADAQASLKWADYGMNVDIRSGGVDVVTLHIQVEAQQA